MSPVGLGIPALSSRVGALSESSFLMIVTDPPFSEAFASRGGFGPEDSGTDPFDDDREQQKMSIRHSRLVRLVALTVVVSMPLVGMAGVASASKVQAGPNCTKHPHRAKCKT